MRATLRERHTLSAKLALTTSPQLAPMALARTVARPAELLALGVLSLKRGTADRSFGRSRAALADPGSYLGKLGISCTPSAPP